MRCLAYAGVMWAMLTPEGRAAAQSAATLRGIVTDSAGHPISSATVRAIGTRWSAVAGEDGRFALRIPVARWVVTANRVGYRPDTIATRTMGDSILPLIFQLRPAPAALAGITVLESPGPEMAGSVTTETIRQVPPLAEPDVFRAVSFLPAVAQPNDLKGRLHLAGGPSDETGVSLDGHPLQDPFHLVGLLGAFNVAALERADVLIHHLPVSSGSWASGLINLTTRRPSLLASSEVVTSLLSSSFTTSRADLPLGLDLLASGRLTYLDKLVLLVAPDARIAGDEVPLLGYSDALLRLGRSFDRNWRTEAIGYRTRDVIGVTESSRMSGYRPLSSGETLGGIRIERAGTLWNLSIRSSINLANVQMDSSSLRTGFVDLRRNWLSTAIQVTRRAQTWQATIGASVDQRTHAYRWRTDNIAQQIFSPNTVDRYADTTRDVEESFFGEVSKDLPQRVVVSLGVNAVGVADRRYVGPRLLLVQDHTGWRMEVALERRHQFVAQAEEPVEGNVMPPTFFLKRPRRVTATAVALRWPALKLGLGSTTDVRIEGFNKSYTDRPLLRSSQSSGSFPAFVFVAARSAGAAISIRSDWAERFVTQGSYTYQRAREVVDGQLAPSAWDAPHDVAAFLSIFMPAHWSATVSYRVRSGRATTPIEARLFVPYPELETGLQGKYPRGRRNTARVPAYRRLDVSMRRKWQARGVEWTIFGQVLNALNRTNVVDYSWEEFVQAPNGASRPVGTRGGLPILPTIGLEVRW